MIALDIRSSVIADDPVMQLALADSRTVEAAPTFASRVESTLDLIKCFPAPVVVKPRSCGQLIANTGDKLIGLGERGSAMDRVPQLPGDGVLNRQWQLAIRGREVDHCCERLAEIRLSHFHPDCIEVRANEIAIAQVNARRRDDPCDHLARFPEKILVMGAASGTVGED